jgi:hypothetical protein
VFTPNANPDQHATLTSTSKPFTILTANPALDDTLRRDHEFSNTPSAPLVKAFLELANDPAQVTNFSLRIPLKFLRFSFFLSKRREMRQLKSVRNFLGKFCSRREVR